MSVAAAASPVARLSRLLSGARARARRAGAPVLVSVVERVRDFDRRDVLAAATNPLPAAIAAAGTGDRMYWARPDDGFALAGLGIAAAFGGTGEDRFGAVDRGWSALREHAMTEDPSVGAEGAGPLLMGGFSFAPDGPRSECWREYAAASMILPRIQLAIVDGACWATINLVVSRDGTPDADSETVIALARRILAAARSTAWTAPKPEKVVWSGGRPITAWHSMVRSATASIRAGTLEKVVLAREVRGSASMDFDVASTLHQLGDAYPSCFIFGCWRGRSVFVGASPELLVRVDGRDVRASSLAGSVSRGASASDDAAQAAELLASAKDRDEHAVVRRALCTGLQELCDDVVADDQPSLLSLPQLYHLHTDVRARLRDGHSLLDLVRRLHPTPAVGGEPTAEALHFIRKHEQLDRGWYAAPVGWLQAERGEFAVALRSALVSGSEASLFAGCGIVAGSDSEAEYAESLLKLRPMQTALSTSVSPSQPIPDRDGEAVRDEAAR